tara:strand:- start:457 stop:966 length:510 start_codon:yes stop_codon:yes gene_type:complete
MRQIKINSTTGSEIVSTSEFKDYARISNSADDTLIGIIIKQARIWCENYISRDIVAKNRTYYLDKTNGIFDIPFGPIASISSVTVDGTAVTDYTMEGLDNETIDLDGPAEKVKVTYITSGLDDELLQQAVKQFAVTLYDNRHDYVEGKSGDMVPTETKVILNSYKNMFV